jgi:hypothetical protein
MLATMEHPSKSDARVATARATAAARTIRPLQWRAVLKRACDVVVMPESVRVRPISVPGASWVLWTSRAVVERVAAFASDLICPRDGDLRHKMARRGPPRPAVGKFRVALNARLPYRAGPWMVTEATPKVEPRWYVEERRYGDAEWDRRADVPNDPLTGIFRQRSRLPVSAPR